MQCEAWQPLHLPGILVADPRLGGISTTISAYETLALRGSPPVAIVTLQQSPAALDGDHSLLAHKFGGHGLTQGVASMSRGPEPNRAEHEQDATFPVVCRQCTHNHKSGSRQCSHAGPAFPWHGAHCGASSMQATCWVSLGLHHMHRTWASSFRWFTHCIQPKGAQKVSRQCPLAWIVGTEPAFAQDECGAALAHLGWHGVAWYYKMQSVCCIKHDADCYC